MKKALKNSLIGTVIGLMGMVANAKEAKIKPQFTVCVRNYASLPTATLRRAEKIAQRLYEAAGVMTSWIDYIPAATNVSEAAAEAAICSTSMPRMTVNLIDHELDADHNIRPTVLGVAPGDAQEPDRNFVFVFVQVANRITHEQQKADESQVLGHAIAHELGHILAHVDKHPPTGLMRAIWTRADFEAMTIARLNFNPEQAAQIRQEITRRTSLQGMTELATNAH